MLFIAIILITNGFAKSRNCNQQEKFLKTVVSIFQKTCSCSAFMIMVSGASCFQVKMVLESAFLGSFVGSIQNMQKSIQDIKYH